MRVAQFVFAPKPSRGVARSLYYLGKRAYRCVSTRMRQSVEEIRKPLVAPRRPVPAPARGARP